MTWVLIIMTSMGSMNGGVSVESVQGFRSEQTCQAAAQRVEAGTARMFQKAKTAAFTVTECVAL